MWHNLFSNFQIYLFSEVILESGEVLFESKKNVQLSCMYRPNMIKIKLESKHYKLI